MKNIKIANISSWVKTDNKAISKFITTKPRKVKFELNTNGTTEVWCSYHTNMEDAILVASTSEMAAISFIVDQTCYVQFRTNKDTTTFVNIPDLDQAIPNSNEASFTTIEPRTNGSTEFEKMMHFVKLNENHRNQELAKERAALRQQMDELKENQEVIDVPPLRQEQALKPSEATPDATE